jgi:hypothetical protein
METSISIYNQLLDAIKDIKDIKELNHDVASYKKDEDKRLERFYMSLEKDDLFLLFSMAKIKVFSAKTVETHEFSQSLFGENLSLKHIFNNQPDEVKNNLWSLLFNMYIQLEKHYNSHPDRIQTLKESIKKLKTGDTEDFKADLLKKMFNKDVNSSTSNMLEDIIGSFKDVVSNKGNPFENIMGITEKITSKYGRMIENGDIEIDKILGGMTDAIGSSVVGAKKEAEEPVIIDENFSTSAVDIGKEEEESKGGFNLKSLGKLMPLTNLMNKMGSIQSDEDLLSIKQEMDSFMEKELKVDMSQYKEQLGQFEQQLQNMTFQDENDINDDIDDINGVD